MTKRIDTHAHLGECCVFGLLATEEDILRRMDECGVDATIVQPYPGATIASKTHDRIADLCAKASRPLLRYSQRDSAPAITMRMNARWSAASRI